MTPQEIIDARRLKSEDLKKLRLRKKYNISQLSRITGLARHTIVKIETGDECWNIDSEIIYIEACKRLKSQTLHLVNKPPPFKQQTFNFWQ